MATSVAQRRSPSVIRSWAPVLALVALIFVAFALPPYLGLDPDGARVPIREDLWWHYPLMVTHIVFGSIALLASCIQISPAIRGRWPIVHRWSGRAYVLGGIPLVGIPALVIAPLSHSGFVTQVSNVMWALLWLGTTIMGYRMVRAKRYAEHRVWMVRSFALIWGIVMNRLWIGPLVLLAMPAGMDDDTMLIAVGGTSSWMSWVVNLLIAEWWLTRRGSTGRSRKTRPTGRTG